MTIRNLDKIFRPRSVAVIGASDEAGKVGYTVLRNLLTSGFHGAVYPINRQHDQVQGLKAYASVRLLGHPVDLAIICTPAATIPDLVQDCGESGVLGLIILSAGFREAGADGQQLEAHLKEVWSR